MQQYTHGARLLEAPPILQLDSLRSTDDMLDDHDVDVVADFEDVAAQEAETTRSVPNVAPGKLRIDLAVSITISGSPKDLIEPICKLVRGNLHKTITKTDRPSAFCVMVECRSSYQKLCATNSRISSKDARSFGSRTRRRRSIRTYHSKQEQLHILRRLHRRLPRSR